MNLEGKLSWMRWMRTGRASIGATTDAWARADQARAEDALVDALGKMEGGGKVGSKAVLLLPKPAPAPRSQPPAKRARSDDVVFLGSRAAAV